MTTSMMDDAKLLHVMMTALDTTWNVIHKGTEDNDYIFGVMVTKEDVLLAKKIIGDRLTEGRPLFGSASTLQKVSAYALGVMEAAKEDYEANGTSPSQAMQDAIKLLGDALGLNDEDNDDEDD